MAGVALEFFMAKFAISNHRVLWLSAGIRPAIEAFYGTIFFGCAASCLKGLAAQETIPVFPWVAHSLAFVQTGTSS